MPTTEELYAAIFSALSEGVIVYDMSGRIEMSNDSAQHILGLTGAAMSGAPWMGDRWQAIRKTDSGITWIFR